MSEYLNDCEIVFGMFWIIIWFRILFEILIETTSLKKCEVLSRLYKIDLKWIFVKKTFSHLFPSLRALVITFLNGLFGSSTCVFLLFKYLYTHNIAELPTMFLCFTFMQFICYIRTFYLMPKESIPFNVSEISNYDFRNGIFCFVD